MTFLADECVDRRIVERLRSDGHTVLYVVEMEPGIDDQTVLQRANEKAAVLITIDKDFGELVYRLGQAQPGVILVRLPGLTPDEKAELVSRTVTAHAAELPGAFTVLSPRLIRIRRPQP